MPPRPQHAVPLAWVSRPSSSTHPAPLPQCLYRDFSCSTALSGRNGRMSMARRTMFRWLEGPGKQLKYARPGTTNYLGAYDKTGRFVRGSGSRRQDDEDEDADLEDEDPDHENEPTSLDNDTGKKVKSGLAPETQEDLRPFPLNRFFRSEPVLSEELRHEIFRRVMEKNQSVREVSIALNVEMARVGAVVRLMTIEQDWIRHGKELARPYQAAVLSMVPTTPFDPKGLRQPRHESINDLPVHPATQIQIFHPTSESRQFTRVDAGKVFHPSLMPADERIPHPEMIEAIKDRMNGMNVREVKEAQQARIDAMAQTRRDAEAKKAEQLARSTTVVEGKRWDFKFVDCKVDATGKEGRSPSGVGWRYGFPHEDRKKGQIKIQTKVEY